MRCIGQLKKSYPVDINTAEEHHSQRIHVSSKRISHEMFLFSMLFYMAEKLIQYFATQSAEHFCLKELWFFWT